METLYMHYIKLLKKRCFDPGYLHVRIVDLVEHPVRRIFPRPVREQVGEVEGRRVSEELDEDAARGENVHRRRQVHPRASVGHVLHARLPDGKT